MAQSRTLGIVIFEGFALLGRVRAARRLWAGGSLRQRASGRRFPGSRWSRRRCQKRAGPAALADHGCRDCPHLDLVLVPGGIGTRREITNAPLLDFLKQRAAAAAEFVTSVLIGRIARNETAERIAVTMEYEWHRDANRDPFTKIRGRA